MKRVPDPSGVTKRYEMTGVGPEIECETILLSGSYSVTSLSVSSHLPKTLDFSRSQTPDARWSWALVAHFYNLGTPAGIAFVVTYESKGILRGAANVNSGFNSWHIGLLRCFLPSCCPPRLFDAEVQLHYPSDRLPLAFSQGPGRMVGRIPKEAIASGHDDFPYRINLYAEKGKAMRVPSTPHRLTFQLIPLCFAISLAKLFHSLDRRLHQLFQDLLVHIVQLLDIQASHAGCELAKFF